MTWRFQLTAAAIVFAFLYFWTVPIDGNDCGTIPCISSTSWAATPTAELAPPPALAYVYIPIAR